MKLIFCYFVSFYSRQKWCNSYYENNKLNNNDGINYTKYIKNKADCDNVVMTIMMNMIWRIQTQLSMVRVIVVIEI